MQGNRPLWKHQKDAIEKAKNLNFYGLFFQPGCGKSRTAIEILRHKFNERKKYLKTIIFCPPVVVPNWKNEWQMFSNVDPSKVVCLSGSQPKRIKTFLSSPEPRIYITNYESLLMKDLYECFKNWAPEALVFDESQRLKSHNSKRSIAAYNLANPYNRKKKTFEDKPLTYILTGTPVLNNILDIFQQVKVMAGCFPTFEFGNISNYYGFRDAFLYDKNKHMPKQNYFPNWQPKTLSNSNMDSSVVIGRALDAYTSSAKKEECLDLPPEIVQTIKVEMSPDQKKHYDEMKNELVTYIQGSACVAKLAITKALRLMQITAGFVTVEREPDELVEPNITLDNTPKDEALEELLETITPNGKVLVWACWKENYVRIKRICEKLNLRFVEVHGSISPNQKLLNVEEFKKNKEIKVFIGNPQSAGLGINLVEAAYSIFYSRTFNLEHYLQAQARNYRGGSKEQGHLSITRYDIICQDTIDELVLTKLNQKEDIGNNIFDIIKNKL